MFERAAKAELVKLATEFKSVLVTGPRQSGKTTLVRYVFPDKPYVLLEDPDRQMMAREDPRGFLSRFPNGAVLDEAQKVPELFSYLQGVLDAQERMGLFILTGSCNVGLMQSVSQSLAGRAGLLNLLPLSYAELKTANHEPATLDEAMFRGLYPPLHARNIRVTSWYNSYIATYLERDVRQVIRLHDLATFQRFLTLCAANIGQLLNTVRLGADCGIHHNTVRSWLSVLEAGYLVFRLHPHFRNYRKRLVKTPKLYFGDTGLAIRLLGIESSDQLRTHPLRGALFENWCIVEMLKARLNAGKSGNLYFWRNHIGLEVDVLADHGARLLPVEIKAGATVGADWVAALERWTTLAGADAEPGCVIYGGEETVAYKGLSVMSWRDLPRLTERV